jgi:hypothetical protein
MPSSLLLLTISAMSPGRRKRNLQPRQSQRSALASRSTRRHLSCAEEQADNATASARRRQYSVAYRRKQNGQERESQSRRSSTRDFQRRIHQLKKLYKSLNRRLRAYKRALSCSWTRWATQKQTASAWIQPVQAQRKHRLKSTRRSQAQVSRSITSIQQR